MMSKSCYCGLLIIAVLVFGCGKETPEAPAEQEQAQMETLTEPADQDQGQLEPVTVPAEQEQEQLERTIVNDQENRVKLETSMGDIVIELDEQAAPITVKNFLDYVERGHYDGTIFHRVIHGFMIQGGGLTAEMAPKETRAPIKNEASNGLKNYRGTIAMARTSEPDSATCQFFINHRNNAPLDYIENVEPGYTVFGKVVEGMNVVDGIAMVKTTTSNRQDGVPMQDVPVEPVVIKSATVVSE